MPEVEVKPLEFEGFKSITEEAHKAYCDAAKEYFGDFARFE